MPLFAPTQPRLPRVRDYMTQSVVVIEAQATGRELQRLLAGHRISGCPVVELGTLVGVVSRSDLVRQLAVSRSRAEEVSDYYRDLQVTPEAALDEIEALSARLMDAVRVEDLMSTRLIAVKPDATLVIAAQRLIEHHVHRLLVIDAGRLQGVISSQDLVRAIAAGPAA
jgi:CBS domain-containing protein